MAEIKRTIGFQKEAWKEFAAFFGRNQQMAMFLMWFFRAGSIALTYVGVTILADKWLGSIGQAERYDSVQIAAFAFLLAIAIELGWNVWLPIVVRQIIHRKFGKAFGAWNVMLVFNLMLLSLTGGINAYTVFIGADDTGANAIPKFQATDTGEIDSLYQSDVDSIILALDAEREEVRALYQEIKGNIKASADAAEAEANANISYLRRREAAENTSYRSLRYQEKAKAAQARADAQQAIVRQDSLMRIDLAAIQARQDQAVGRADSRLAELKAPIKEEDSKRKAGYDMLAGSFYYFMMVLAFVFWGGLGMLIIVQEVYKRETLQAVGNYMHEYKDSLFLTFWSGLMEVLSAYFGGFFRKWHRAMMAIAGIIGIWVDYFILAIEAKFPTPTKESLPDDFRVDPLKLERALSKLGEGRRSPGFARAVDPTFRGVDPTGSTGGSTPATAVGAATPQSELSTGFQPFSVPSNQEGQRYQILVQNNEVLWPHIDGITGALTHKSMDRCQSSRSSYRDKVKKLTKRLQNIEAGKASGDAKEVRDSLAHAVEQEAYWDNAILHLREVKAELKKQNRIK